MPVVSFDLDGVIMRGPFEAAVQPRIWAHLGGSRGLAHLVEEERQRQIWTAVREAHDRRLGTGDFVGAWDWDAIYGEISRAYDGEPVPDVATLIRESCVLEDAIALLPGARSGLERVVAAGLRVVAITNGYRAYQWPVLEGLGVGSCFEALVTPDQAGYAKPDPRIFASVPGLAAHVGDTLLHDMLGANQAGVLAIWVEPALPRTLLGMAPHERVHARVFREFLARSLEESRYRPFHPEGTLDRCMPFAAVVDADEAATVLLEHVPRWTERSA